MIVCPHITNFVQFTYDYPNKVSQRIHLLIKNIVLPTMERDDVFFDDGTFNACVEYVERYFYPLFPYQKFIYAFFFMYDADDLVAFRTFVILMGRGNGKDGLIAPLVNFLQTKRYGVKKYHIDIVANAEAQAEDTFMVVYDMMNERRNIEKFKKHFYISREKIVNIATMSRLRFNTSNSGTKDGKQTGLILYNEYHGYPDNSQISVFESGAGKVRHFRKIVISTQGDIRDGPLDELLATSDAALNGEFQTLRYFPFICTLDDPSEVDDPAMWAKANPSIDYRIDLKNELTIQYEEMKSIPSKRHVFMTKRMNIPERDEQMAVTSWPNILATTFSNPEAKPNERIDRKTMTLHRRLTIGAFDYASIRDFASAGFLFKDEEEWVWRQRTWICRNSPFFNEIKFPFENKGQPGFQDFVIVDGPSIDEDEMVDWFMEESKQYELVAICMDSYRYELMKRSFDRYGIEPRTKENPYGLLILVRSGPITHNMVAPLVDVAFAKRQVNFGNSAIMRWYTNNTMVKTDRKGNMSYEKIEPKLRKNDGYMAFIHATTQRALLDEVVFYI